jgi:hypothetical protein
MRVFTKSTVSTICVWQFCLLASKIFAAVEYAEASPVVVIDYADLVADSQQLGASIAAAYGFDGLGILAVKNVPRLTELRKDLLPLAFRCVQVANHSRRPALFTIASLPLTHSLAHNRRSHIMTNFQYNCMQIRQHV